jgi:hypothetical protein
VGTTPPGPYEQRVTEPTTQFGERIADAGLTHVHLLGDGRYAPLLHQSLKKQQQIEVDVAQFHDAASPIIQASDEAYSRHLLLNEPPVLRMKTRRRIRPATVRTGPT